MKILILTSIVASLIGIRSSDWGWIQNIINQPNTLVHQKHIYFSGSVWPEQRSGLDLQGPYSGYLTTNAESYNSGQYIHHTARLLVHLASGQSQIDLELQLNQFGKDAFVRIDTISTAGKVSEQVHALVLILKQYQHVDLLLDTPTRKDITTLMFSSDQTHHRGKWLDAISYSIMHHTKKEEKSLVLPELPKRFIMTSSISY